MESRDHRQLELLEKDLTYLFRRAHIETAPGNRRPAVRVMHALGQLDALRAPAPGLSRPTPVRSIRDSTLTNGTSISISTRRSDATASSRGHKA